MGIFDMLLGAFGLVGTGAALGKEAYKQSVASAYSDSVLAELDQWVRDGKCPSSGFFESSLMPYNEPGQEWDKRSYRYFSQNKWWGEIYQIEHEYTRDRNDSRWWWDLHRIHERNQRMHPGVYGFPLMRS